MSNKKNAPGATGALSDQLDGGSVVTVAHGPDSPLTRLLARLVEDENGCLIWTGAKSPTGYGHISINGRVRNVHRVSYELHVSPVPDGLVIDHLCRNRACANPDHLEAVTPGENTRRGEPAQRTHCPHGHAYDQANTYRPPSGGRVCRACHRESARARRGRTA